MDDTRKEKAGKRPQMWISSTKSRRNEDKVAFSAGRLDLSQKVSKIRDQRRAGHCEFGFSTNSLGGLKRRHQMNRYFYRQIASNLMVVTGLALILVNAVGFALGISADDEKNKYLNDAITGHSNPAQDTLGLQGILEEPMTNFDLESVNNRIFESIIHSNKRKIRIYENWLLWLGGKFYEPLSRTQNPRMIVSGGEGLCSEVSAVFNSIAGLNGFKTRFVGLSGHVVSEVRTDKGWRIADPDYGVTYPVGLEVLEKQEGTPLMRQLLKNKGYKEETIYRYIQLFQSTEDNIVTEVDVALSPRLYAIELASEWLKWIIPSILIFFGIIISKKTHNNRVNPQGII